MKYKVKHCITPHLRYAMTQNTVKLLNNENGEEVSFISMEEETDQ